MRHVEEKRINGQCIAILHRPKIADSEAKRGRACHDVDFRLARRVSKVIHTDYAISTPSKLT